MQPRKVKRYGNQQTEVENDFPTFGHVKRALYQNAEKGCIAVDNPHLLPIEYQQTSEDIMPTRMIHILVKDSCSAIVQSEIHLMLISASDLDLRVLHESKAWIMDGTFKVRPKPDFCQLYTIHVFGRF